MAVLRAGWWPLLCFAVGRLALVVGAAAGFPLKGQQDPSLEILLERGSTNQLDADEDRPLLLDATKALLTAGLSAFQEELQVSCIPKLRHARMVFELRC